MAWECSARTLQMMVSLLKANRIIQDPRVEAAMLKVDRSHYCTAKDPYIDAPFGIGFWATISAPHMHAYALEALKDKLIEGASVLDVGSGSGYLTACMAHMVGPTGTVIGVEHIKELVSQSKENIRRDAPELLDSGRIKLVAADGRVGVPDFAPYDVIHVGATAPDLPKQLIEQLKEGGLMVVPVQRGKDQMFERIEKLVGGELKITQLLNVRYVPLTDVKSQLENREPS